jgi:hypothetical protein
MRDRAEGSVHTEGASGARVWDLDEEDACDIMASLRAADSTGRIRSATTHEWMYLFKPQQTETTLYLKLILRSDCIVISFHGDEDDQEEI